MATPGMIPADELDLILAADRASAGPPSIDEIPVGPGAFGASPQPEFAAVGPMRSDPLEEADRDMRLRGLLEQASTETGPPVPPAPGAIPVGELAAALPAVPGAAPPLRSSLLTSTSVGPGPGGKGSFREAREVREERRLSPEQQAYVADLEALAKDRAAAGARLADIEIRGAEEEDQIRRDAAVNARVREQDTIDAVDEGEKTIRAAKAEHQDAYDKFRNFKFQDFWADKSTGSKVAVGIGMVMGALGAAIGGGKNPAQDVLEAAIDKDFTLQRERLGRLKEGVAMALTGVADATLARKRLLDGIDLKEAAARDVVASRLDEAKSRIRSDVIRAQVDVTAQKLREDALELRAKALQNPMEIVKTETINKIAAAGAARAGGGGGPGRFPVADWNGDQAKNPDGSLRFARTQAQANQITAGLVRAHTEGRKPEGAEAFTSEVSGKPATDAERDADTYAQRMTEQLGVLRALPTLSQKDRKAIQLHLAAESSIKPGVVDYLLKKTGLRSELEQKLSPDGRAYYQAIGEFAAANLRKESGAAISATEYLQAFRRFGAQLGDTDADVKRKRSAMEGVALNSARRSYRPSFWEPLVTGKEPKTAPGGAPPAAPVGAAPAPAPRRAMTEADRLAREWANANPGEPQARQILTRQAELGL